MPSPKDTNARVGALLRDLAAVQASQQSRWGYKRAASAILSLEEPLEALVQPDGTLRKIPGIGPASSRVILEYLQSGGSPTVERAIQDSARARDVFRSRELREHLLSRAQVAAALCNPKRRGPRREHYHGDLQMHSTYSDGMSTLDEIIEGCRARGWKHKGRFRLLEGIEANILSDGRLDMTERELRTLEIVGASPHAKLRSSDDQTARMIAAVRTPGVHILGHPRGRRFGSRPGVNADWERVFAVAASVGVAIEIDGDPSRQDIDYSLARKAIKAGCIFALDSDAHSVSQFDFTDIALAHARLAGIPRTKVINCWHLDDLLEWAARAWQR